MARIPLTTRLRLLASAVMLGAAAPSVTFAEAKPISPSFSQAADDGTVLVGETRFKRRKSNGLVLRGTCHLTYFGFQIADAALYMRPQDSKHLVLDSALPKELEFFYLRSISARDFARSTTELIGKNGKRSSWRMLKIPHLRMLGCRDESSEGILFGTVAA